MTSNLSPDQAELLERLSSYRFGGDAKRERLLARVRSALRCTRAQAELLAQEYLRYCFLARISATPLTPSQRIDAVWHEHLDDSREYWEVFNREILKGALHHVPGDGSRADANAHQEQYAATLAAYRRVFGDPPQWVWPAPPAASNGDEVVVRIAQARLFDDGSRRWLAMAVCVIVGLLYLLCAGDQSHWNPLAWGPHAFLLFFAAGIAGAGAASFLLRDRLSAVACGSATTSALELALLTGGPMRLADVALCNWLRNDAIAIDNDGKHGAAFGGHGPHVRALRHDSEASAWIDDDQELLAVRSRIAPRLAEQTGPKLIAQGLWMAPGRASLARWAGVVPAALLMALGLLRWVNGIAADRPVGFLTVLLLVLAGTALAGFFGMRRATRTGTALVERMRRRTAASASADADDDLLVRLALFGSAALVGSELSVYGAAVAPQRSDGGSSCGGAGGCSGGAGCGGGCGG